MAITRIKNNQITDLTVNAASKLQDFSITAGKIANNLTYGSDLTVAGNLTISGVTTTIDTTNLSVEDALLLFSSGQTGSPTLDIGFIGDRGDDTNIAFVWDESEDKFVAAFTTSSDTGTNITVTDFADLQLNDLEAANVLVTGDIDISGDMTLSGNVAELNVTGNFSAGNIQTSGTTETGSLTANTTISATGNVSGGNITTAGEVDATGNVSGGNLNTSGTTQTGDLSANTSISAGTTISATGNVSGGNLTTAGVVDATGNVSGGNLNTSGTTQTGDLSADTSISAGTTITATGNVSGGNLNTSGTTQTGDLSANTSISAGTTISATGNVSGGNITTSGEVDATGNVIAGNLTTSGTTQTEDLSANSSISAGTTISATGNVSGGNLTTAGEVDATGNVTGGNIITSGVVDATGNVSGGNFTTSGTTQTDSLSANTTITATGNVSGGNITTAGEVDATGNVTGGNLNTSGTTQTEDLSANTSISAGTTITATGNVSGGNITTAGEVDATGNVSGGNLNTSGTTQTDSLGANTTISATGNVSGGNLNTSGTTQTGDLSANTSISAGTTVTATGNVSGGNITTAGVVDATGNINGDSINADTSVVAPNVEVTSATVNEVFFTDANSQLRTDANLTFDTSNLTLTGSLTVDNIIVDDNTITSPSNVDVVIDSSGSGILYIDRDATVSGNLSVLGTTTTVNSEETTLVDPIISIGRGENFAPLTSGDGKDRGIAMYYYDTEERVAFMGYDDPSGEWRFFDDATITDEEVTGSLGDVNVGGITSTSLDSSGNVSGGNITTSGEVDATGNVSGGNLTTSGTTQTGSLSANTTITATGNVSGGNLTTAGTTQTGSLSANTTISATGNVSGGNITTGGVVDATGNVSGGNITTAGEVDATGNVSGGNITTAGEVDATGNVSGGNLTTGGTTQTGSLSANTTITATGNVSGGNIITDGVVDAESIVSNTSVTAGTTITATGNVSGGNITTAGEVDATGNVSGGNITTGGVVDATGNVSGGNLTTSGTTQTGSLSANTTITATGNVSGGNITTSGEVDATGNVSGGNITTAGEVDATGNISGGNLNTSGTTQTGDLSANTSISAGTTITATGNVSGGNITTGGVVDATGNISGGNLNTSGTTQTGSLSANTTISATGNVSGGNITTGGVVDATGNVSGGNLVTSGELDAETVVANTSVTTPLVTSTSDIDITSGTNGNISLTPDGVGEIVLPNLDGDRLLFTTANSEVSTDANASFNGEDLSIIGSLTVDNVTVDDNEIRSLGSELIINRTNGDVDLIVSGSTVDNLFVVDAGTDTVAIGSANVVSEAILTLDSTDSMILPSGTTGERPASPAAGMFRYNSTEGDVEYYDGSEWVAAGTIFTVIESDTFSGDGSTTVFTLNDDATTSSAIVSINGVVQLPTTAYAISGTTLTFTEAPESGDDIEVRRLTTTTTVGSLANADTSAALSAVDGEARFDLTGNLLPSANVTYNLGSDTARWNELYLAGNTITLGDIVIKDGGSNTVAFFAADGVTPATLDSNNVDTTTIANGTSTVSVVTSGGNVVTEIAGSTVTTTSSTGISVTGGIEASSGFVSGTSNIAFASSGGNATISVGGNANVGVFTNSGLTVTGSIEATNGFVGLDATTIEDGTSSVSVVSTNGNIVANVGGSTIATFTSGGLVLDSSPTSASQAATKGYVDEVAQGLLVRPAVFALADSNLSATYDNGTDGVGATLTSTSNGAFPTIDGVTLDTVSDRILVIGQTNAAHNGLYVLTVVGDGSTPWELTRCSVCDESDEIPGSFVFVQSGTTYNATGWKADVADPTTFTVGTDDITWLQFSGAGTFTAGNGIELDGTEFRIDSTSSVEFAGLTVPSITKSGTDGVGNIGSSANSFDTVHAKATSAQYADLAELYVADANYVPGTVVSFGGTEEVTVSDADADSRIAGVISTNPSFLMNSTAEGENVAAVALTGRVPTRVTGKVRKGDMMVSNGDGTARAESSPSIGSVIGKSLENFDGDEGIIEVVVGRL